MELDLSTRIFSDDDWKIGMSPESFLVFAPSREEAFKLATMESERLAKWALQFGRAATVVRYPGGKPYRIPAEMAEPETRIVHPINSFAAVSSDRPMFVVNQNSMKVYASPDIGIGLDLMKLMDRMVQSDRPMFLLTNGDAKDPNGDRQIWINQLACDMIQSAGNVAVTRSMRDYWNAVDLESLHQKLRDTSTPFEHPYSAILNDESPDVWFKAVSRYEPVEIDGRSLRLSINQSFEIVARSPELATFR